MGLLALLWGSSFLWIELALTGLSPVQVTVLRSAFGAAALLVLCRISGLRLPRDRRTWGQLVIAAFFCNVVPFALFAIGQQTVDSGVAGVLNATTPLWSVLIGLGIGAERGLRPARAAGLLLGFAGVLLIFAPWELSGLTSWGTLAILGAAASYAIAFAYMGRKLVGKESAPLALSAAQLLTATGLSALALPAGGLSWVDVTPGALLAVAALGVFGTGFTFALNYRLIADVGATSAATVGYLLPVVSVALGALVLGEDLNPRIVLGMVVVLAGVGLTRIFPASPCSPSAPASEVDRADVREAGKRKAGTSTRR